MLTNERRLEFEQLLHSSSFPPRTRAQFTAANDHNPLILQDCPHCRGSGKRDLWSEDARTWTLDTCADCGGTGISGEVEHYFLTDTPEATAIPDAEGWLRCPGCGIVFTTRDPHRWTGYRHLRCGQRIHTSTDAP
jgi:hypothetical protein